MILLDTDFDEMTLKQRALWFATCGCNAEEIAEWLSLPRAEVQALFLREAYDYEPLRRPA